MHPVTRLRRSLQVGSTAAAVWGLYRVPAYGRRLAHRAPPGDRTPTHERAARLVLATALSMRGVIIKLCQAVATRSDVFPPAFIEILKQCHDAVPPKDWATVSAAVERELGKPVDAVFSEFERVPLASASLAQVHRARLQDGRAVAVKVQYPDIEDIVRTDLANMHRVCSVYERFDPQPIELLPLLTELTRHIGFELDFEREAESADHIRELFRDDPKVVVPRIHREWSTPRILTMELVDGIRVTEKQALEAAGLDPARVVQDLMHVFVRMIMGEGFFQADPHPGNIFVRPNGQLVLMDFGLCKQLPEGFGLGLFELMFSMMTLNQAAMIRAFEELGFETKSGDPDTFVTIADRMVSRSDTGRFEGEFTEEMTNALFEAIRENPVVRVPSDFVLVGRAFGLLSGIAHTLGHRANVLEAMGATTG